MTGRNDDALAVAAAQGTWTNDDTNRSHSAPPLKFGPDTELADLSALADGINHWHDLAAEHAGKAVEHARHAGKLLLQVKAALPHGAFLPWVEANVHVTPRQCQRYMAAAQGKPLPLRYVSECDTVSHLDSAPEGSLLDADAGYVSRKIAEADQCDAEAMTDAQAAVVARGRAAWVEVKHEARVDALAQALDTLADADESQWTALKERIEGVVLDNRIGGRIDTAQRGVNAFAEWWRRRT